MEQLKTLNMRFPRELWAFGKKKAIDRDSSFNQLIVDHLTKYKRKCEKKLENNVDEAN